MPKNTVKHPPLVILSSVVARRIACEVIDDSVRTSSKVAAVWKYAPINTLIRAVVPELDPMAEAVISTA